MNNDVKLLGEAYEQVSNSTSANFIAQKKEQFKNSSYFFGMTGDGKPYVVVEEYDKYSDGDRWFEDVNHYFEVEGQKGIYVSENQGKALIKKAYQEHPELNQHIDPQVMKSI